MGEGVVDCMHAIFLFLWNYQWSGLVTCKLHYFRIYHQSVVKHVIYYIFSLTPAAGTLL